MISRTRSLLRFSCHLLADDSGWVKSPASFALTLALTFAAAAAVLSILAD